MADRREIHIVNPLWNAAGGSEWHAIELLRELSSHADVKLWTENRPDPELLAACEIHKIDAEFGIYPRGGTLIFVGVYQLPGHWIALARPRRVIVLYNTLVPRQLEAFMRHIYAQKIERIEIVYSSEALRQRTRLRGIVELSFIDVSRFTPRPREAAQANDPFVVGRLSRDNPHKHHPHDLDLYRQLLADGCRVRIMGGTCLRDQPHFPAELELIPAKSEPAAAFLSSLDCFFYRTAETLWETFGRVVHEAMACGLPVVCHRRGGYITSIDHGTNGFLFDTSDEAFAILRQLQHNRSLRASIGAAARATIEAMYSPAERQKIIDYFLM